MTKAAIIRTYFTDIEKRNYTDVIKLFSPEAIVHSPLYGKIEAPLFFKELFSDTHKSRIAVQGVFCNEENPDLAAAHFVHHWTMKNGEHVEFEGVDLFEFLPKTDTISNLRIIYDTSDVRRGLKLNGAHP